jgi:hypothetical protein
VRRTTILVTALAVAAALEAGLAQTQAQAQAQKPSCASPEHRQFDFWIGEWEVRTPDGKVAGRNRIEKVEGGCGLQETWTAAGGGSGRSINAYFPGDRKWHQAWLGSGGLFMHIEGGLRDGSMRLEGETPRADGTRLSQRITWTPQSDGRVRQHWEQSTDGGRTWTTAFDGVYVRSER